MDKMIRNQVSLHLVLLSFKSTLKNSSWGLLITALDFKLKFTLV